MYTDTAAPVSTIALARCLPYNSLMRSVQRNVIG